MPTNVINLSHFVVGKMCDMYLMPHKHQSLTQGFLFWEPVTGQSPDVSGGSKNVLDSFSIPLKKWRLRRQAINQALLKQGRVSGNGPLKPKECLFKHNNEYSERHTDVHTKVRTALIQSSD